MQITSLHTHCVFHVKKCCCVDENKVLMHHSPASAPHMLSCSMKLSGHNLRHTWTSSLLHPFSERKSSVPFVLPAGMLLLHVHVRCIFRIFVRNSGCRVGGYVESLLNTGTNRSRSTAKQVQIQGLRSVSTYARATSESFTYVHINPHLLTPTSPCVGNPCMQTQLCLMLQWCIIHLFKNMDSPFHSLTQCQNTWKYTMSSSQCRFTVNAKDYLTNPTCCFCGWGSRGMPSSLQLICIHPLMTCTSLFPSHGLWIIQISTWKQWDKTWGLPVPCLYPSMYSSSSCCSSSSPSSLWLSVISPSCTIMVQGQQPWGEITRLRSCVHVLYPWDTSM